MSLTKVEHVLRAYGALRISGLTTTPNPKEIELGLNELEDMMSEFKTRNICSSYFFEDEPEPNTDSEIDPAYNNATQKCLAIRLSPYFGIEPLMTLQRQATQALSNWSARSGKVNMINPPSRQPRGSGNTFRFPVWIRFYRFEDGAPISCSTFELKVDEINFFSVDFNGYLLDGATITSFELDVSNGIEVITSTEADGLISLECKGIQAGNNPITITVTTSTGRINPEKVYFNITV